MASGLFRALELWLAPGAGTEDAYDPASLAVIRVDKPRASQQPSEDTATAHDNEAITGENTIFALAPSNKVVLVQAC